MLVELTHDQSAVLRDAESFTRKERNEFLKRMPEQKVKLDFAGRPVPQTPDFDLGMAGADETLVTLIESWTLAMPIPSEERKSLDDINAVDAGRLEQAAAQVMRDLLPNPEPSPTVPPSPA